MPKECDHTSVGILVWRDNKLLLIERKLFPFGFAPPAGHVDGDSSFKNAAKRELKEEVGLEARELKLLWEGREENKCRRINGNWHYWKIYEAEASDEPRRSLDETKQLGWYTKEEIKELADRTEGYLSGKVSEEEWEENPGLETIWFEHCRKLNILT